MENISLLIKEAKPLYIKKKKRAQKIKQTSFLAVGLICFSFFNFDTTEFYYDEEVINNISTGSIISDMGLPVDEYGLLQVS